METFFLVAIIILGLIAIIAILVGGWLIIYLGVAICMIAFKDQDQIDEIIANKYRRIPDICAWGFVGFVIFLFVLIIAMGEGGL